MPTVSPRTTSFIKFVRTEKINSLTEKASSSNIAGLPTLWKNPVLPNPLYGYKNITGRNRQTSAQNRRWRPYLTETAAAICLMNFWLLLLYPAEESFPTDRLNNDRG